MKKNHVTKLIALLMSIMLIVLAGCGAKETTTETTDSGAATTETTNETTTEAGAEAEDVEPVHLRILIDGTGYNDRNRALDVERNPVYRELVEKTGVTFEFVGVESDKFSVILASGDLPDIIIARPTDFSDQLINGGNIIPLDGLIAERGQDMVETMPEALAFSKANWSEGTNETYFIPPQVGVNSYGIEADLGPTVRWDKYKAIGAPKITSTDDLLDAIEAMVALEPETADGRKVYGVSAWSDWGDWVYKIPMGVAYGQENMKPAFGYTYDNEPFNNVLDVEKSAMWASVKFMYEANKRGILDPDMLTQKFSDFEAKAAAGQIMYSHAIWGIGTYTIDNAVDAKGFMRIPLEFGSQATNKKALLGWVGKSVTISKDCENPEKAMDWINFIRSYEGARLMHSGVEGLHWDYIDGVPTILPETHAMKQEGGQEWSDQGLPIENGIMGLNGNVVHPDGYPVDLFRTKDALVAGMTNLHKDYSEHYGVEYPAQIMNKYIADGINGSQENIDVLAAEMMAKADEDILRIDQKLQEKFLEYAAKCILSTSDEEFAANQAEAIAEFEKLGANEAYEWYAAEWARAREASKALQ